MPKAVILANDTKYTYNLKKTTINSLQAQQYEVVVIAQLMEYQQELRSLGCRLIGVKTQRHSVNPLSDFDYFLSLLKIFKEEKPDLILSYSIKPNVYGSFAARCAGIEDVFPTINGLGYAFTDGAAQRLKSRLVKTLASALYKSAFRRAKKVFFQNRDDALELSGRGIVSPEKCVIIAGSGIDMESFPYSEPPVAPMRFLMATRLLITKGVRTYFEAARIVKKQYPQAEFQIVGALDPNPDSITQEELDGYIADKNVEYLGYVTGMAEQLAGCSVFVLPSYYREGVPHATLEAMSVGRAVITTNSPGCRETVRNADSSGKGDNGFLIEPKNSGQLAEAMSWMIEHPNMVKRMGRESRKYAEERFDAEKVNRVILETMGALDNARIMERQGNGNGEASPHSACGR